MNQFNPLDEAAPAPAPPLDLSGDAPAAAGRRRPVRRAALTASAEATTKVFVLDTNVLLHDPSSIGRFADNEVCVPVDVLSELDGFKNEQSDRGANARAVHRALTALFNEASGDELLNGVPTAGGGTLRLALFDLPEGSKNPGWLTRLQRILPDLTRVDNRIIATALRLQAESDAPVTLVTKDLNLQLKARAVGLGCDDYLNDKVEASEVRSFELRRIDVVPTELQRFASSGTLELPPDRRGAGHTNEYVLLCASPKQTMPARVAPGGSFHRLATPKALAIPNGASITAANLGQQCLLDALLDPEISLVTCYGHAGTGKTLLAVAAGLASVFDGTFRGLTVSRPVVAMGDTLGFLPGNLEEKMRPWLQPVYDALDFLMPPAGITAPGRRKGKAKRAKNAPPDPPPPPQAAKPYSHLIENGVIEIEALCYIRGRSIPQRFFVLDEAQQLTPLEAKTVVTRMSKRSKLVMVGDPAQIDNPYVDSRSNGLVYTRHRLKGQAVAAHVPLAKGERSELAELGATLM